MKRIYFILLRTFVAFSLLLVAQQGYSQLWNSMDEGLPARVVKVTEGGQSIIAATADSISKYEVEFNFYRWNGITWNKISSLMLIAGSQITEMFVFKDDLYIAGIDLKFLDQTEAKGLLRLRNGRWQRASSQLLLKDGRAAQIHNAVVYNGNVYLSGQITHIDNLKSGVMVRFNGSQYSALSTEHQIEGTINDLAVYKNQLIICGPAFKTNNSGVQQMAIYNGNAYSFSNILNTIPARLFATANDLFMFGISQGNDRGLFVLDGNNWTSFSKGITNIEIINSLVFFNNTYWASGIFILDGRNSTLVRWSISQWIIPPTQPIIQPFFLFHHASSQHLYAFGGFRYVGRLPFFHIAHLSHGQGHISGRIYWDYNQNCTHDSLEVPLPMRIVRISPGPRAVITDSRGFYNIQLPAGNYRIAVQNPRNWQASQCSMNQRDVSLSEGQVVDNLDFPQFINPSVEDVEIRLSSNAGNVARRGVSEVYGIHYRNNGARNAPTGKIRITLPEMVNNFHSIPEPDTKIENILEWNFVNLQPGESGLIRLINDIPQSTGTGDRLTLKAQVIGPVSDQNPLDNDDSLSLTVIDGTTLQGKFISPEPEPGDTISWINTESKIIDYTIRFENRGNDTIRSILVLDTIDLNLDITYVQVFNASHSSRLNIINLPPGEAKGVLAWHFDGIRLPPSFGRNDCPDCRGHVGFRLALEQNIAPNTLVPNRAAIVFDDGNPQLTNTVYAAVPKGSGLYSFSKNGLLQVYPNPSSGIFNIAAAENNAGTVNVFGMNGQHLFSQEFSSFSPIIDLSAYPAGLYVLQLINGSTMFTTKILKSE